MSDYGTYDKYYPRQNKFSPSDQLVNQIRGDLSKSPHKHHGLRVDDVKFMGALPKSRHWKDGVRTDSVAEGVSTIGLPKKATPDHIRKALNDLGPYSGKYLTLVGGKSVTKGEDKGEHLISDASAIHSYE